MSTTRMKGYKCELCGGDLDAHPFYGMHYCGFCLAISIEREMWLEDVCNKLSAIRNRNSNSEELSVIINRFPTIVPELAKALWEWNLTEIGNSDFAFLRSLKIAQIDRTIDFIAQNSLSLEFSELLQSESGERAAHSFLDEHHHLLRAATGYYHPGDAGYCMKEFRLGSDYVADFLVVNPRRSLAPLINLVELEPIAGDVFTKKGLPSQRLATAMRQVKEWRSWIDKNTEYFLANLKKKLKNAMDPVSLDRWFYHNEVELKAFIFIGRRDVIKERDYRPVWVSKDPYLTIHSYDTIHEMCLDFDLEYLQQRSEIEQYEYIKRERAEGYVPGHIIDEFLNRGEQKQ